MHRLSIEAIHFPFTCHVVRKATDTMTHSCELPLPIDSATALQPALGKYLGRGELQLRLCWLI